MGRSSSSGRSGISHHYSGSSFRFHSPYRFGGNRYYHIYSGSGTVSGSIVGNVATLIFIAVIFMFIAMPAIYKSNPITVSTVDREPLPAGSVQETDYYTDTLFWFGNDTQLLNGMKHFYQKTGVQPYLYITDTVDGSRNPSSSQMEEFAGALYDELFQDEAHLLLVFQDADGHYTDWVITGVQAKQVVDDEAVNILLDYVDRYYYDTNMDESMLFGKSFSMAADRMMSKSINTMAVFIVGCVIVTVVIAAVCIFKMKKDLKQSEDEQMERMLNMDLNAGDAGVNQEVKDLENKYTKSSGGN